MTNLRLAVTAVVSLTVGGFVGFKVAEKRLITEFEQRLDKETDLLRRMYKSGHQTPGDMVTALYGQGVAEVVEEYAGDAEVTPMVPPEPREHVSYEKIRPSTVKVEKGPEEPVKTRRVFEPEDDRGTIYVISNEEFESEEVGYQQEVLTYYAKDGVITDINEDRMEDYTRNIGTKFVENFGTVSGDENVVHVRNEVLLLDYEINRSEGSYREEVLGEEWPAPDRPSQRISRGG